MSKTPFHEANTLLNPAPGLSGAMSARFNLENRDKTFSNKTLVDNWWEDRVQASEQLEQSCQSQLISSSRCIPVDFQQTTVSHCPAGAETSKHGSQPVIVYSTSSAMLLAYQAL